MEETPDPARSSSEEIVTDEAESVEPDAVEDAFPPSEGIFQVVGASYRGPIPPPQMLGDYNAVLPGLAERIVKMAEKDQGHVHKMDRLYLVLRFTGQAAALLIALAGLIIGGLLIDAGHNIEGLATLIVGLGPVVGAFLYRQIKSAHEEV